LSASPSIVGRLLRLLLLGLLFAGIGFAALVVAGIRFDPDDPLHRTNVAHAALQRSVSADGRMPEPTALPSILQRSLREDPEFWYLVRTAERETSHGFTPDRRRMVDAAARGVPDGHWYITAGQQAVGLSVSSGMLLALGGGAAPTMADMIAMVVALVAGAFLPVLMLLLLVFGICILILQRLLGRELRALSARARALADAPDGLRLDRGSAPADLDPLVDGFNSLLAAQEARLARARRFLADAAHELRQPLTRAAMQASDLAPSPQRGQVLAAIDGLDSIVATILSLARVRGQDIVLKPLDLALLARTIVAERHPSASEAGQSLGYVGPPSGLLLDGDEGLLRSLLGNLIDNAVRHAPTRRGVRVRVSSEGDEIVLGVEDGGGGLTAAQMERLVQPFTRGTANGNGLGLGLALVAEAAAHLRGRLEQGWVPDGSFALAARFPASAGQAPRLAGPKPDAT
jgi:signal transduction histidine kinase